LFAQAVGEHTELGFLCSVEFELAADPFDHPRLHRRGFGFAQRAPTVAVVVTVGPGRKAAEQHAGPGQADQGALDPGFHRVVFLCRRVGRVGRGPGVEQGAMLGGAWRGVLSRPYRCVTLFFAPPATRSAHWGTHRGTERATRA
jgi:hypothetical protein